jgi:hypothetical protein
MYSCRSCKQTGFESSASFLQHGCCTGKYKPEVAEQLIDINVESFQWDLSNAKGEHLFKYSCVL